MTVILKEDLVKVLILKAGHLEKAWILDQETLEILFFQLTPQMI